MKKMILACALAAVLAGCSWGHHDRGYENSGSSTPPAQAQSNTADTQSQSGQTAPSSQDKMNWSDCEQHPYTPGPKACK